MSRFMLQWMITSQDEGQLIREFLKQHEISKAALTDIKFKGGKIAVNDEEVTVRYPLKKGDVLKILFPQEEPSEGVKGENIPLSIVYEDEYVLVINKSAGMNSIPSREHPNGSLANGIVGHYKKIGLQATAHIVTRLDRDTSGLVLVAKARHVHYLLSKLQKEVGVKRTYQALVAGHFNQENGTIIAPIARKSSSIIEREVNPLGQYACTHYHVLRTFPSMTHIELRLETGRTHQIRVHMAHIGHPLLGDDLYGGCISAIRRQALHCCRISFHHPVLKKTMEFAVKLPEDMSNLIVANS